MKHFLLQCLLLITCSVFAQVKINGWVTNKSNEPISYATFVIKEQNSAVFSNEQGQFELTVPTLPITLFVHVIGYEQQTIQVNTVEKLNIILNQKPYELSEVIIKKYDPYPLFYKAYKRLIKHRNEIEPGKCFYRLVTKNDSVYTELMEVFSDIKSGPCGFKEFEITDGRFALDENYRQKEYIISIDFSAILKFLNLLNDHDEQIQFPDFPFRPNAKYAYEFSNEGVTMLSDKRLRIIGFKPIHTDRNVFSGKMYVEETTGKLFRIEVSLHKATSSFIRINAKNQVENLKVKYLIEFEESPKGIMLLKIMNVHLAYQTTYSKGLRNVETTIECLVYDRNKEAIASKKARNNRYAYNSDYTTIRSRLYIKPFWDEHVVLTQTSLQKEISQRFESKGLFGISYTYLNDTFTLSQIGLNLISNYTAHQLNSFDSLPAIKIKDPYNIDILLNGKCHGTLCSKLFLAQNCYQNTYYFNVLPVMISAQTWISDSLKNDEVFPFVYNLYARLANIHANRLINKISRVKDPCKHIAETDDLIDEANKNLLLEENELLNDVWGGKKFLLWEKYINREEEELGIGK